MKSTTASSGCEPTLRAVMAELGYTPVASSAAVAWLEHRNTLDHCPIVEPCDLEPLTQVVVQCLQRQADREADLAILGSLEQPVESWPSWTDAHTFEPTAADREWAVSTAAEHFQGTVRRTLHTLEHRSMECAAVDAHTRGLHAPDAPRTGRGRVVLDWTDADQARHHGGSLRA